MPIESSGDPALYYVVVNQEEQYSIWPQGTAIPLGWKVLGEPRAKADCLAHIEEAWTDMRPLSLRMKMGAAARQA